MMKLVICILAALGIAALSLQLRQQRLELNFEANKTHDQIERQQARLWDQQLQIGIYTAANAVSQTVSHLDLRMVPRTPLPAEAAASVDPRDNPHAE